MKEKRYMNEEGKIVSNYHMVPCANWECDSCPNAKKNNGLDVYCGAYFIKDRSAWMKNKGYREIFELENYTDKGYVMVCHNLDQSKLFARFLAKNGRKWANGESYLDDNRCCFDIYPATNFVFNRGLRVLRSDDREDCWGNKLVMLDFEDYVFKMEDKKMEKVTKNDRINSKTIKHCVKDGMQVVLRDGEVYLVETNINGKLYLTNNQDVIGLECFDDDMTHRASHNYDVITIYHRSEVTLIYPNLLSKGMCRELLWERDEATPMTQEQIEAALGYKVKIKED